MFSGGSRYVYTHPVLRSNSKFDVLKNSLSVGQLNSILPSVVSSGSLCSIRSPTLVLAKSGTYQSRAMVPFLHMNSLMDFSLVLCSSTMGFVSGFGVSCGLFSVRCCGLIEVSPGIYRVFQTFFGPAESPGYHQCQQESQ